MKKIFTLFVALALVFSGCSSVEEISDIPTYTIPQTMETQVPVPIGEPDEDTSSTEADISSITPTVIPDDSSFEIIFLDVGQADAALVSCDDEYMLIDGGNKADSNLIYSVLKQRGIDNLSIVVGTHGHEDHIGGLAGALSYATADIVLSPVLTYDSDAFENFKRYSGELTIPNIGDQYTLGSAIISILGVNSSDDTNDSSIVLKIVYGETSFLFTGDLEYAGEQVLLASGADLSATVLKVGHHGSDTSTSYLFLREIMPQYAVISCGAGNSYGHPTDTVLSRLRDADVTLYRTDLQGDIICTSDGQVVTFTTDKIISDDELLTAPSSSTATASTVIADTSNTDTDNEILYVLNTSSHKFHYPDCYSVTQMAAKNYATSTEDRTTLISQGYSPCGNCDP